VTTPLESGVYYTGVYWNSYERVVRHLNRRAYDSEDGNWLEFVRRRRGQPFDRALSLNCGNGWLERDAIVSEAARQVVAIDFMEDLLAEARMGTQGLPIEYHQMDTNLAVFPDGPFDCIINHAAGHHIANLDRVFRACAALLSSDGWLLTWDYTGPHRNQYGERIWRAATRVNEMIPVHLRSAMSYPHLPTMLATDPTEAIHSDLVLATMDRYFVTEHFRRLGGPVAYLLLTHNQALFDAAEPERDEIVEFVLREDELHIAKYPEDSLFTFSISRPRDRGSLDAAQLDIWEREELDREAAAEAGDGRYYLYTSVAIREYPDLAHTDSSSGTSDPAPAAPATSVAVTGLAFARAVAAHIPGGTRAARAMRQLLRKLRRR
jgi:SAM-dependent methyltransferase